MIRSLLGQHAFPIYESILGRHTYDHLREYERNQWLSVDELQAIQLQKLKALLAHCEQNVPFYARRWKEAGVSWRDVNVAADLQNFPTIDKEEIRSHYDDFIATAWRGRTMRKSTGGSTGRPFSFEYTRESYERRMAVMMRGYGWADWKPGVKRLDIWGTELGTPKLAHRLKSAIYDAAMGRRVLSCFKMSTANVNQFVEQIDVYRPDVVVGYTSALETMATWMEKFGAAKWRPKSVITAAEMLGLQQRALLERQFRAPVFHTYGCREFMLIGAECEVHDGYHASADHLVVEVTNENGQRINAGVGNVVITDLHNYGMPFVRYANGDLATVRPTEARCSCGRSLPLLGPVEGRRLDMLSTPDGRFIPGEFFPHLMKDFESVESFQVRQTQADRLDVYIVKRSEIAEDQLVSLRRAVGKVVGAAMTVEFRFVDQIPLTPSGKRRVTIREVADDSLPIEPAQ